VKLLQGPRKGANLAFLVPVYPGCPGKEAVKSVFVGLFQCTGIAASVVVVVVVVVVVAAAAAAVL